LGSVESYGAIAILARPKHPQPVQIAAGKEGWGELICCAENG
jgi:hypothetical protein